MQFIVMQAPKKKERAGLVCRVMVVEAKSKAEALRLASADMSRESYFRKPVAEILVPNQCYRI